MKISARKWTDIYEKGLPGFFLRYPCSNLVSIFYQNKNKFKTVTCLDNGFGSGNNTEFLLNEFDTVYGNEVSEENLNLLDRRLSGYKNYEASRFFIGEDFNSFNYFFDVVISWGVLGYNDSEGIKLAIENLRSSLKKNGVIFATIPAPGDIKTVYARKVSPSVYEIDKRIPHQEGCIIYSPASIEEFLLLFDSFNIIDYGSFNRKSFSKEIDFAELFIVASKK